MEKDYKKSFWKKKNKCILIPRFSGIFFLNQKKIPQKKINYTSRVPDVGTASRVCPAE